MDKPALLGGQAIRQKPWPQWPPRDKDVEAAVLSVLRSGRWAISGFSTGRPSEESKFAAAFRQYNSTEFCIPTASGTAALMCALQALGVGAGDEVIVPGLTWVACATAVAAVNAHPVFVDIDADNLCLCPQALEDAITEHTRAVMVVHLYAGIADLERLLEITARYDLPLIEDCAQSHGAVWGGRRVGSWGRVGTFSMQQGKALTCGEGGACITDDAEIADCIYRLRSDARRLKCTGVQPGYMELEEAPGVFGQNFCLSEIHAAMLKARLKRLDDENSLRADNVAYLKTLLQQLGGFIFQQSAPGSERTTVYHFPIGLTAAFCRGMSVDQVAQAISAELGVWVHRTYPPLNRNPMYRPSASARFSRFKRQFNQWPLPNAEKVYAATVLFHHSLFLANREDMEDIVAAFQRVQAHADRLRAVP